MKLSKYSNIQYLYRPPRRYGYNQTRIQRIFHLKNEYFFRKISIFRDLTKIQTGIKRCNFQTLQGRLLKDKTMFGLKSDIVREELLTKKKFNLQEMWQNTSEKKIPCLRSIM